jgi:hypothetical protein
LRFYRSDQRRAEDHPAIALTSLQSCPIQGIRAGVGQLPGSCGSFSRARLDGGQRLPRRGAVARQTCEALLGPNGGLGRQRPCSLGAARQPITQRDIVGGASLGKLALGGVKLVQRRGESLDRLRCRVEFGAGRRQLGAQFVQFSPCRAQQSWVEFLGDPVIFDQQ